MVMMRTSDKNDAHSRILQAITIPRKHSAPHPKRQITYSASLALSKSSSRETTSINSCNKACVTGRKRLRLQSLNTIVFGLLRAFTLSRDKPSYCSISSNPPSVRRGQTGRRCYVSGPALETLTSSSTSER